MVVSSRVGEDPLTDDDYYIAKAMLQMFGNPNPDPHRDFKMLDTRPPNYATDSRAPSIVAVMAVLIALIFLITGTRLTLRRFHRKLHWGSDDWMVIPGAIGAMAWMTLGIVSTSYAGVGKHAYNLTYYENYMFFRLSAVSQTLFFISICLVKISITLFNRRLTGLSSTRWMFAHYVFLVLLGCYLITIVFVGIFTCIPPAASYSILLQGKMDKPAKCQDPNVTGIGLSTLHVIFDFCLLSVPIILLWRVQLRTAKKVGLFIIFAIGSVSCIGSIMRQVALAKDIADYTYEYPTLVGWTVVDLLFGVCVASLPTLNSLFMKCLPLRKNSSRGSSLPSYLSKGRSSKGYNKSGSRGSGDHSAVSHEMTAPGSLSEEGICRKDEVQLDFRDRSAADDSLAGDPKDLPWAIQDPERAHTHGPNHVQIYSLSDARRINVEV